MTAPTTMDFFVRRFVRRSDMGFSLLEMLVVLAIAATLTLMAQGVYSSYTIRLHRMAGQTALLAAMQRLEQHRLATGTYGNDADQPETPWVDLPSVSSRETYRIEMVHCPSDVGRSVRMSRSSFRNCVLLRAEPQHFADPVCGALTLRSDGVRGAEAGSAQQCW